MDRIEIHIRPRFFTIPVLLMVMMGFAAAGNLLIAIFLNIANLPVVASCFLLLWIVPRKEYLMCKRASRLAFTDAGIEGIDGSETSVPWDQVDDISGTNRLLIKAGGREIVLPRYIDDFKSIKNQVLKIWQEHRNL